jgi:DNA-binding transcriptional LysR family regulator
MAGELNDIATLVRVVDLGSFAKVARELGVPTSTVTRAIARLEESLETRMLQRNTRKLTPTSEGRGFYEEVAPAVATIQRATRNVASADGLPRGVLHVSAPSEIGSWLLARTIVKFTSDYPGVRLEVELSGRAVNLVEEGFDVALQLGELDDSSLVSSKLVDLRAGIFASADYVAKNGAPLSPGELEGRPCILYRTRNGVGEWILDGPEGRIAQVVRGRINSDDYGVVRAATLDGAGIARLPRMMAVDDVREGRLVPVLLGYEPSTRALNFVHESRRNVAPKIKVFRSLLLQDLARRELEWRVVDKGAARRSSPLAK